MSDADHTAGSGSAGERLAEQFFEHAYDLENDQQTLARYADWASQYDEALLAKGYAQPDRAADLLLRLVDDRAIEVLDVGCGTGLSGRALTARGFTVIDGTDYSPEMLAEAERSGIYRALRHDDFNRPPTTFEDDQYDAITVVGAFAAGHLDPEAVHEILRILRPGGVAAIALNRMFWEEDGRLREILDQLVDDGAIEDLVAEHGEHIPGIEVTGWVIGLRTVDR